MAAKKPAPPSLCEQGGPEIQVMGIRVKTTDVVDFSAWICNTAARVRAVVTDDAGTDQVLVDQTGLSKAAATLPRLSPGAYTLTWSFIGVSGPWQTRIEVAVNDTARYRHRKDADSNDPFLRGFLFLDVVA